MNQQFSSSTNLLLGLLCIIAISAVAIIWVDRDAESASPTLVFGSTLGIDRLDKNALQAVFLTNGQVYFGNVTAVDSQTMTLENIFYLQENQELQASEEDKQSEESSPAFTLAKLGKTELHAPEDIMVVNLDHVLFWENLKSDSQVVKAVQEYQQ